MKRFESAWREGFKYYERYYDTELKKSIKRDVNIPWDFFEPSSKGIYSSILDDSVKLVRKSGRSKDAHGKYGCTDPMYRNIRDNYWNKPNGYNSDAEIWYLDIETRVGMSFTFEYNPEEVVKVRNPSNPSKVVDVTVGSLRSNESKQLKELECLVNAEWVSLVKSNYLKRNSGFPKPGESLETVSLIQLFSSTEQKMYVFGLREWKHQDSYNFSYEVEYVLCENEVDLFNKYFDLFSKLDPLVVYAWNGDKFDFPYIYNRLVNIGLDPDKLSNYGDCKLDEKEYNGMLEYTLSAPGHYYLDMLPIYKKFTYKPVPNYTLDTISNVELKTNKVQHTEYAAFDDFYTGKYIIPANPTQEQQESNIYKAAVEGDWEAVKEWSHSNFVYYGCIDTFLIKQIDDKRNFSVLLFDLASKMGVQLVDTLGTVRPWFRYISNQAFLNNKVVPPRLDKDLQDPQVTGGYVREPQKGKHKWILSVDVNSMYPLLSMVGFNMSPETFIPTSKLEPELRDWVLAHFNDQNEEKILNLTPAVKEQTTRLLQKYNVTLGINGAVFDRSSTGMVPDLVTDIYSDRKKAKQTQIEYEERGILIESILKKRRGILKKNES